MMYLARIADGECYVTPIYGVESIPRPNGDHVKKDDFLVVPREPKAWKTRTGVAAIDYTRKAAEQRARSAA